jgi:hypothetical protein
MNHKNYIKVSGFIFLVVALVHAWRLLNSTPITFGTTHLPLSVSWIGLIVAGYMAFQGLKKR